MSRTNFRKFPNPFHVDRHKHSDVTGGLSADTLRRMSRMLFGSCHVFPCVFNRLLSSELLTEVNQLLWLCVCVCV